MKIVRFRGRLIAAAALSLVVLFAILRTFTSVDLVENDNSGREEFVGEKDLNDRGFRPSPRKMLHPDVFQEDIDSLRSSSAQSKVLLPEKKFDRRGFHSLPRERDLNDANEKSTQQTVKFEKELDVPDAGLLEKSHQNDKIQNLPQSDILPSYLLPTHSGQKKAKYPILTADKRFVPSRRIVHLDLKGAPPKLHFFKGFFEFIAKLGATGILLEYEDMFPFSGELAFARSSQALTERDVGQLLDWARDSGLEVVPLVQTFGHLEWILKHERFAHLREVDRYAQVICLSNPEAVALVKTAVDQVLRLHGKHTGHFFHMGADEAFQVGMCQRCQETISSQLGNLRDRLMLRHIANISSHVRDRHGKRVLMWHDMLNNVDPALVREFRLETLVEPVVWNYAEQVDAFLPADFWQRFASTFPFIWGSSAFKGADGPSRFYSNVPHYLRNHESWNFQMTNNYKSFKEFRGLILTGWQRFDHFAVLAELLPVGIPSLAINLLTVAFGQFDRQVLVRASRAMQCGEGVEFAYDSKTYVTHGCNFPGAKVYELVQDMWVAQTMMHEQLLSDYQLQGWLAPYNSRHNFSSAWYLDQLGDKVRQHLAQLDYGAGALRAELAKLFGASTVDEFLFEYVDPDLNTLRQLLAHALRLGALRTFPGREFAIQRDAPPPLPAPGTGPATP